MLAAAWLGGDMERSWTPPPCRGSGLRVGDDRECGECCAVPGGRGICVYRSTIAEQTSGWWAWCLSRWRPNERKWRPQYSHVCRMESMDTPPRGGVGLAGLEPRGAGALKTGLAEEEEEDEQ